MTGQEWYTAARAAFAGWLRTQQLPDDDYLCRAFLAGAIWGEAAATRRRRCDVASFDGSMRCELEVDHPGPHQATTTGPVVHRWDRRSADTWP